ncbi:TonB-dependent receptor [Rivibacter subsaxonicus]|uniref:TonB-dependent receptor n=1 Tax=Rivibacter subsaxonicus TaxID=457575 RepID=UPI0013EEDD4A|nr:TonB-dependent receptor [Rivibacter subsaxonicus]
MSLAVLAVCAGGFAAGAMAQQQPPQKLDRVEVTGSNIKRIDAETVAPVEVITRDQIQRSGQPNVAELIRNLPANTGGSFGESFSNSFAPGAAGVSLRGLGQKTTLVLLNSRRVAGYGFAQNLNESFVDLNSIPTSMVERIEILKDGASAIYGSDAIAGVVNIILRKEYAGIEANLSGGTFEGKKDYGFNLTGGFGDLAKDRFNVFGDLSYYSRDLLQLADTEYGATRDMRRFSGGRNFVSLTGGGTWRQLTPAGGLTNNYRAITDCAAGGGTVMTGPQAAAAGLINLTPPTPGVPGGQTAAAYATNVAMAAATNSYCARDFNDQFTALPGTERLGLLTRGTFEFSPTTSAYAELGLSRNKTEQKFQAPFFAGTTGLTPTAAGLSPFTYNINFAPGSAGNPYTSNARYVGVLQDMGTRDNEITSDTVRLLTGLRYELASWEFDTGLGYSYNEVTAFNSNRLTLAGTSANFNVPTSPQPPIPVSNSSQYNLDQFTTNSAAARDAMRANFDRKSKSELAFFDTRASTQFQSLQLPGGALGAAVGVEFRRETLKDEPAPIAASGGILGQGVTATDGSRTSSALYGELALPITKQIEAQLAARYDRYSDFGGKTTPKVGIRYTPMETLLLRANWGKGFRAPTLPEISPSVATFFTTVVDPEDDASRQVSGVYAGNPNLKAETSTSTTVGFVFEPIKNVSASVDWYRIDWRNVVASPSFQDIIDASCPSGAPCPSTPQVQRDPQTNFATTISSNYENLDQRLTSGVDVDLRWIIPTAEQGKWTLRGNGTYVDSFKENGVEYAGTNGGSNTIPRFKGAAVIDWDYGPWALTSRLNYTRGFEQTALGASYYAVQDPRFQTGVYKADVPSFSTVDFSARYNVNKNFTISGAVLNVFDRLPNYDPGFTTTYFYDFSLFDIRGRQLRLNLNYKM